MINGYTTPSDNPELGLQRDSTLMWWDDGDADLERGLAVGSSRAIFDQHFYQRGRFGRTLSTLATADERFGGDSPVGVGVDYATGIRDTGDTLLSGPVRRQLGGRRRPRDAAAPPTRGPAAPATLSARKVLTHLMTDDTTYDLGSRVFSRDGTPIAPPSGAAWSARHPRRPCRGTVFLGGGVLGSDVIGDVVTAARAVEHLEDGQARRPRWRGELEHAGQLLRAGRQEGRLGRHRHHRGPRQQGLVEQDPGRRHGRRARRRRPRGPRLDDGRPRLPGCRDDRRAHDPVVLADGAMTAVLGARWSAKANAPETDLDAIEAEGVAAFRADDAAWLPGLALVPATLVPHLTDDYRWGRLYAGVAAARRAARRRRRRRARPSCSPRPVPRSAAPRSSWPTGADGTYWTGANGALGASGVVLDVFGDGEAPAPLTPPDAPCDRRPLRASPPPAVPRSRCGDHRSPRRRTTSG